MHKTVIIAIAFISCTMITDSIGIAAKRHCVTNCRKLKKCSATRPRVCQRTQKRSAVYPYNSFRVTATKGDDQGVDDPFDLWTYVPSTETDYDLEEHVLPKDGGEMRKLLDRYSIANAPKQRCELYSELDQKSHNKYRIEELKFIIRNNEPGSAMSTMSEILLIMNPVNIFLDGGLISDERTDILKKFKDCLKHPNSEVRCLALNRASFSRTDLLIGAGFGALLYNSGDRERSLEIVGLFSSSLSDADPRVRYAAIEALTWCVTDTSLLTTDEYRKLIKPLANDESSDVRKVVAELLSNFDALKEIRHFQGLP